MHRTKTEAVLAAAEAAHADDPERAELLACARRFKASWIELAEALSRVRHGSQWKAWGFDSFEQYARSELHLKPDTVDKLTGSYVFLRRRAPEVIARDGVRSPIPTYQAVDFLRRAEEESDAPSETLRALGQRVLEEGAPFGAVAREFRDTVFPIGEDERRRRDADGLRNVASRLRDLLGRTHVVPRRLASNVTSALEELLGALEEAREEVA